MFDENGFIQLNESAPEPPVQEVSLNETAPNTAPVSQELADSRAYKAVTALPDIGMSHEQVSTAIANGQENDVRMKAAADEDTKKAKAKAQFVVAAAGRGASLKEVQGIAQAPIKPTDPKSVFEDAFAGKWMDQLKDTSTRNETVINDASVLDPAGTNLVITAGKMFRQQSEFLRKGLEDAQETYKNQEWGPFLADQAKDLASLGLYSEAKLRGQTGISRFKGGLLGSHLEETAKDLLRTPNYDDFKQKYTTIMEGLKADNPTLALTFAQYMVGKAPDEQTLDNVLSAVNLSVIPGLAKNVLGLAGRGAKTAVINAEVKKVVKDMVLNKSTEAPAVAMPSAAGDAVEAGVRKATNDILKNLQGANNAEREALEALPTHLRVDAQAIEDKPGHWGREIVNRFKEQAATSEGNLLETIKNVAKVDRIPASLATEGAVRRIAEAMKDKYPGIVNNIMDVGAPKWNSVANTYDVDMVLGKSTGEFFFSEKQAAKVIKDQGLVDAKVSNAGSGLGYYVHLSKPLRETDNVIRDLHFDAILKNKEFQTRKGIVSDFASWLKTPEDTLSFQERVSRKTATYAQHELEQLIKGEAKYIRDVSRGAVKVDPVTQEPIGFIRGRIAQAGRFITGEREKTWDQWDRMIKAQRDMLDENGQKGRFFKDPAELEDFYQRTFQRMPSYEETAAFLSYKRALELDRTLRNLAVYRNKSRVGAEQHQFTLVDAKKTKIPSGFFDGVSHKKIPLTDDNYLVLGDTPGSEAIYHPKRKWFNQKQFREISDEVANGTRKVVEVYDPEVRPFSTLSKNVGDLRVRYVIAKNTEVKPLSWDQVPRRGGGHFDYDYDHYIKQANIRPERVNKSVSHWYEGDTTIMPIALRAMGHDVAKTLNEVRTLMAAKKWNDAKALFVSKMPTELEWKEFKSWFDPKVVEGIKHPPRLNVNEPFYVVPKGKNIIDLDKSLQERYIRRDPSGNIISDTFRDGTKEGSLARQNQVQYTGHRDSYDLFSLRNDGTPHNPLYKWEQAAMVDPIPSMNRALQRMINSTFMDDYKTFAVENWLQEAREFLKADVSDLRSSPFWHFEHPDWKPGVVGRDDWNRLMSNRFKIKQFVGTPNKIDTALHTVAQKLSDSLYNKFGPEGPGFTVRASKINDKIFKDARIGLDPAWVAHSLEDPFKFIRAMTFHAKLGLYALPQLFVQAQTYALIYGISPRHAIMGTQAAFLHGWGAYNPAHLDVLDRIASARMIPGLPHWKAGEFKEGYLEMRKTGFNHVGGEYATLDSQLSPEVIEHMGKAFLNFGAAFFRGGEKATRIGAWYTAFKEFRTANPIGAITNADRARILERADLLTSNMSRASQSLLHNGVLSFPAQFLTYQLRNAELIMGKRLGETWQERALARARIMTTYGALYGLPGSVGVSGLPLGDYYRQWALDHGYVVGEKFWRSLLEEGGPAMAAALITGSGDNIEDRMHTGNWYNIGPRYGTQGFQFAREALQSDQTLLSFAFGAAGSVVANTVKNLSGFFSAMADYATAAKGEQNFKLKPLDVIKASQEIASVHSAHQAYIGVKTGQWLDKSGALIDSTSPVNAAFMAAFGLSPTRQSDKYLQSLNEKADKDIQNTALKHFIENAREGFRAMKNNDPKGNDEWMARAWSYLGPLFPEEKYSQAMSKAAKGWETVIEQADRNYYLGRDVPEDARAQRRKTYEAIQQIDKKRREAQ